MRIAVAGCQFDDRSRLDGAFEVQMQFGFGQRGDASWQIGRKRAGRTLLLAGRRGPAGVGPGGEPVGADVGGGVAELADERGAGLIVEAVVVVVGVVGEAGAGAAIGQEDIFQPGVGVQAAFKGVIGGVVDVGGIVGAHREEERVAFDEIGGEADVDAGLAGDAAVEVFGGVERIVGLSDVAGERGGQDARLLPIAGAEGVGEALADEANLPGQQAGGFELGTAEFGLSAA